MTKEDIQKVLELALEYYKLEVFGTGKESENPSQERIDWIYDRMKEEQSNRPKSSDGLEEAAVDIADCLLATPKDYVIAAKADYWNGAHDGIIAGAQWQKDRVNIDISKQIAAAYQLGEKGKEEQMLKDAVEGLICATITGTDAISFLSPLPKELTAGDKVRIIIVKEEE